MTTHAKRRVGRPALSPDTQRITVTLRPADIEYLDKLSDTRSGAIRKLIERNRTMNNIELTITIPTDPDHYTADEADQHLLPELLDNQERKISEWLDANYPGMTYEIERVPEKLSRNNRDRADSERAEQALEQLNQYIEDNWYYWWPEAESE